MMETIEEMLPATQKTRAVAVMSARDVLSHVRAVKEVMNAVMLANVHYGTIPGAGDKPTLLKSGAEVLCMTFRIADKFNVQDMSAPGVIRYRVECVGEHQESGLVLGSGLGECSTDEEKYKWRRAVCQEEFDSVPENMRRIKYGRGKGGSTYTTQQVRTEPADLANTVLKMACKRAKIAMVLNVTAASDMFSQDLEDLDAELARHLTEDDRSSAIDQALQEWIGKAQACTTVAELKTVSRDGSKAIQNFRDNDAYSKFAGVVQAHGATLRAQEAAYG